MDREEAYRELVERLQRDLDNYEDYCIGEKLVRKLLEDFRQNNPLPELLDLD